MTDDPIGEDADDHRVAAWIATTTGAMLVDLVRHQDYDRRWGGLEYEGDRRAHHMIVEELARLRPRDTVLSEEGRDDRSARFLTAVAVVDPTTGREWTAEGSVDGVITRTLRGSGGFGYDPVFEVDGRTLAEMTSAEKHAISHRARAIQAIARVLGQG